MEKQTLNKHDFKKYLLEKLPDSRQEELIFWKKGIPLPIDLVYRIFDQRGELLKIYLDHVSSIFLYSYVARVESLDYNLELDSLPSSKNRSSLNKIAEQFRKHYIKSRTAEMTSFLADKLFVVDYNFTEEDYITSLCHEGRKYKRLYLPLKIKEKIRNYDSELLQLVGISNGDMFGNIVADALSVYRSGFSDAFSAIFNKLLDFILERSSEKQINISTASKIKISNVSEPEVSYSQYNSGRIIDGSLWEPRYSSAISSYILNSNHPYIEFINKKTGIEVLIDIASQSAFIENETLKESTRKVLEEFRQDISRRLRLISERV